MSDWKVKFYITLVSILSPIVLLFGPLINGMKFIGERHFEGGFLWQFINFLLAPFIMIFCSLIGITVALVLTIPTIAINSVRFWRIVITESGLNFCSLRII